MLITHSLILASTKQLSSNQYNNHPFGGATPPGAITPNAINPNAITIEGKLDEEQSPAREEKTFEDSQVSISSHSQSQLPLILPASSSHEIQSASSNADTYRELSLAQTATKSEKLIDEYSAHKSYRGSAGKSLAIQNYLANQSSQTDSTDSPSHIDVFV